MTLNEDGSVTIIDNGRGIPVGINKKTGLPAVEVVYTMLHAGGKFGDGNYKISGGLHGVGASVVNALSEWLEVTVKKDGDNLEVFIGLKTDMDSEVPYELIENIIPAYDGGGEGFYTFCWS